MVMASIAAIVWWAAAPGTAAYDVALAFVMMGGLAAVLVNLNPLIPLDGYYALSDWLEVPNLRQRAFGHLSWIVRTRLLGQDLPMPPADEREQRIFLLYGTLAVAYTGLILLVSAAIAYGWVSRVLGGAGIVAIVLVVWLATRQARRNLRRAIADALRELRAKWLRGTRGERLRTAGGAALLVILLAGFLPWPINADGPFVVAPGATWTVIAPDSGLVFEVSAAEGARVRAGDPLLLVRNLEREREVTALGRATDSLAIREAVARARGAQGEASRLGAELRAESARLAGLREQVALMAVRSPGEGVVVSQRPDTLVGRMVSLGDTLLTIAGVRGTEARLALTGTGASLARRGQRARLVAHADPRLRVEAPVSSMAEAASADGTIESRVALPPSVPWRPGMTGRARVLVRTATVWEALWWGLRSRIRPDLLL
jgi:putative peptide zinc metalloprotease protein